VIYNRPAPDHEVTAPRPSKALRENRRKARGPSSRAVADHMCRPPTPQGHQRPDSAKSVATLENNAREFRASEFFGMNDIARASSHHRPRNKAGRSPPHHRLRRLAIPRRMARSARSPSASARRNVEQCAGEPDALHPRSKNMRSTSRGSFPSASRRRNIILAIIARIGTAGGTGYVIEYAGDTIRALSMEDA